MGVSIYYEARRSTGLSEAETELIKSAIDAAGLPEQEEEVYEHFLAYELHVPEFQPRNADIIFSGATGIKTAEEEKHWAKLLSTIRGILPDASWQVHVEGEHYEWDEKAGCFFFPVKEPPPTLEVKIPSSTALEPEAFIALAATALGLPKEASSEEIAAVMVERFGDPCRLLFCPKDEFDITLKNQFDSHWMLWSITGKLSFPGVERQWVYSPPGANKQLDANA
ncbi:MAG: hypothetical protein Q7Q71_03520 [Verrucomicrobiota bacterium JB023]|nr:hypothetical protein [Verrucomicrobiota bacterium JB023]